MLVASREAGRRPTLIQSVDVAAEPQIVIVQDSREQDGFGRLFQTPHVVAGLPCGDYSILGLEELISIERKSLPDLINSLTNDRKRFEAELKAARRYHRFFVVMECCASHLLVDDFGQLSRAHPRSVWGTIAVWSTRYVPFIFGHDRPTAARLTEALLVGYAREFHKRAEGMVKAAASHVRARTV